MMLSGAMVTGGRMMLKGELSRAVETVYSRLGDSSYPRKQVRAARLGEVSVR